MQKKSRKVVLSFPFSGALYAYFENQLNPGRGAKNMMGHGYYKTLFGPHHDKFIELALTLIVIYDEIYIVPADNSVPDYNEFSNSSGYVNPHMGVIFNWDEYYSDREEVDEIIESYLHDPIITNILPEFDMWAKKHILTDSFRELQLSEKHDCPIICSRRRESIFQRLRELRGDPKKQIDLLSHTKLDLVVNYVSMQGLLFNPKSIEALYETKGNSKIRNYAEGFVSVLDQADSLENPQQAFLNELENSIFNDEVSSKASGAFDMTSIALGVAGFIETLGIGVPIASTLATGASKTFSSISNQNKWFELGPEIKRVTSIHSMKKEIEKQKSNNAN